MRYDPQVIRSLVHRDHVHRLLYLDPDVFDLEMDRIFGRSWVYIGHDSLIPNTSTRIAMRR